MSTFVKNPLVNILRVEIVTYGDAPQVYTIDTIGTAVPEPYISKGEEKELRVHNRILAQELLEDIIKGYDIKLTDAALTRELLEVLDGGSARQGGAGEPGMYTSPVAGEVSSRTRFGLSIYCAEKDYGGNVVAVFRFTFPGCVGSPASFKFENGVFVTPEYTVRSRPAAGRNALTITCLDSLPLLADGVQTMPAEPADGQSVMLTQALELDGTGYAAGTLLVYDGTQWRETE